MNWYNKILIAGSVEEYLQSLGATSDIVQYIMSQGANSQLLVNEFRKNPSLTIEQLQTFSIPQQEQIEPYTKHEQFAARPYPEPMKQWILVSLRKIRTKKELSPPAERTAIHNFYMRFIDTLPQMLDWVERSDPRPDISSYSPEQAIQATDEWHKMMASQGEGVEYGTMQPGLVMYGPEWNNPEWKGWTIQKVMSANDLEVEGNKMDHCVGAYCEDVERQHSTIYSLRDPQNNPHVTIETGGEKGYTPGGIKQIQGKSNSVPKNIYKDMIKEWISTSGDKSGINREINAFENLEEEHAFDGPEVLDITNVLEKILQGEQNEYGLKYVFDSDMETVVDQLLAAGEGRDNWRGNQESEYRGDIAESSSYISNLALMLDLKLPNWPRHAGEWEELRKMPKQSDWKNIREIETWAWKNIDEITEDFHSYETGLDYPQEEDYEDPQEYEEAMIRHDENEAEIHTEWLKNSIKGGFSKDLLDEIKSFRKSNIVPSAQELFNKEKEEQRILNEEAEKRQFSEMATSFSKNWYKKAQQNKPIAITSYNETYNELGVSFNGGPTYTYYKVNPYWYRKINVLLRYKNYRAAEKILKVFGKYAPQHEKPHDPADKPEPPKPEPPKPEPPKPEPPKKPQQSQFPFMEGNWFGKMLYAAIWDTDPDGSFEDNLKAMSELEYKLQALNNWPFSGMPQRKENIIKRLEEELWSVIEEVKGPLESTFAKWLSAHALTDPSTWAEQRMDPFGTGAYDYIESIGEEQALEGVVHEYIRYKNNNNIPPRYNTNQEFSEMLSQALSSPDNFPSLRGFRDLYARDEEERLQNDLYSEGLETFGENYRGEAFQTEEEAEQWIEEQIENFDLSDHIYDMGMESFLSSLQYSGVSVEQFMKDLNQHIVFPLWMNYWGAMGIEGTRELAQDAYERLESASSLHDQIAAINHAIDVNHQNGEMIEYMGEYSGLEDASPTSIKYMMDMLTGGHYIPQWNQELEQIGISVPKETIPVAV